MAQTLVSTIGGVPGTGAIVAVTAGTTTVSNPTSLIFTGASVSASGSAALVAITASTGGGAGTVTSLTAGSGITLSPSTITSAGSIAVQTTGVTAGTYSNANITVNAQGQVTAASSGGGLVWLGTFTATATSALSCTGFVNAAYADYKIVISAVVPSGTLDLRMLMGTGAGPTYDTGNNYVWQTNGINDSASSAGLLAAGSNVGFSRIFGSAQAAVSGRNSNAEFTIHNLTSATNFKMYSGTATFVNSTPNIIAATIGGWWGSSTSVTAIQFTTSTGTFSGTVKIYGLQQ